jgi:uncharacterized protein YndB with AHSA1/START domain
VSAGDAVVVTDDGPLVRATMRLAAGQAGAALDAFTDPALLAQWWGGELTADLTAGGPYVIRFPQVPATLDGRVVSWVPAESLEFTWGWEHEPDEPRRTVLVRVSDSPPVLTIAHGPHASTPDGSRARAGHRAGWEHFLPRLAALLGSRVPAREKPERADG